MVYKRPARETWTFQGRTPTGWKQIGTLTSDKALAGRIEGMWADLAETQENWDLLGRVLSGGMRITELYRLWHETKREPKQIRNLLSDVDLEPLIADFLSVYRREVKPDTAAHVEAHVRAILPAGKPFLVSEATPDRLTSLLYAYPGKRNTVRKVHADLSVFFQYCTDVKRLFDWNPMFKVKRPTVEESKVRFYELETVEQIVGAQPTLARRALFALMYGGAVEVSTALGITRADIDPSSREVRAAGTKAHQRDRVCRIADWAWPTLWEHAKTVLPNAALWPAWTRWTVSDWHRETVKTLELRQRYPLHCARHHWAVRAVRAGTPIAIVQNQLGHGSPTLTLRVYGRFKPDEADREKWERAATEYDTKRRKA
jgi:integrase